MEQRKRTGYDGLFRLVLRRYPHLDRDRVRNSQICAAITDLSCQVVVCGGSHGGFLSLHLLAQFPSLFKAAAVRNPVTNVATMFGATDIPDWCEEGKECEERERGLEKSGGAVLQEKWHKLTTKGARRREMKGTDRDRQRVGGRDWVCMTNTQVLHRDWHGRMLCTTDG
eukprot:765802-Hanusia_phi.AAC.12